MIGMQDESELENVDSSAQNVGVETSVELITATNGSVVDDAQNNVSNVQIGASNNLETTNISTGTIKNEQSGDVKEYVIFRADFKHTIESRYSKRDAITLLRMFKRTDSRYWVRLRRSVAVLGLHLWGRKACI